ncbi:MAG: O-acetylserine sulfhydrylase [Myxococcales bacterium]
MHGRVYDDITALIGRTPVVRLNRTAADDEATILVKLELANPGGSVKDRIGLAMIEDAERRGELEPGMVIVEPTSGNTGIALAMVAAVKGYRLILTMPESMSLERRRILEAYGAELVLTPAEKGMRGALDAAAEIVRDLDGEAYMPMQFDNPSNPDVHRRTTAQEVLADVPIEQLDAFVSGVGTGGTVTGVGEVLKPLKPSLRIVAVEPERSPVLSGGRPGPHRIQGIGAGFVPKNLNPEVIDQVIQVSDADAFEMADHLARKEGILCGISSGAIVWAAREVARELGAGRTVLAVICDTGERYWSSFEAYAANRS